MRLSISVFLPFILLLAHCKTRQASDSGLHFIGGDEAVEGQFPASLAIPGCTASKIAANWILTAAHCTIFFERKVEDLVRPPYQRDAFLEVSFGVRVGREAQMKLPVRRMFASKIFMEAVRKGGESRVKKLLRKGVHDLAIIEVCAETSYEQAAQKACLQFKKIAIAELKTASTNENFLILGGYGAEYEAPREDRFYNDNFAHKDPKKSDNDDYQRRLNFAPASTFMVSDVMAGFKSKFKNIGVIQERNLPIFQLGGGDSGGPVYLAEEVAREDLKSERFRSIVGVNSFTSFETSNFTIFTKKNALIKCIKRHMQAGIEESSDNKLDCGSVIKN